MLRIPGSSKSKQAARIGLREQVITQYSPRQVYGALLWYVLFVNEGLPELRKWKVGWASYAFKELFGTWPSDSEKCGEPMCCIGTVIEKWIAQRPKKVRKKEVKS